MKLTPLRANALFVLLVSVAMTAVMSFGILLLRLGWQADFIKLWLGDFLIGCGLSIPTGFTVVPVIRRWIDGLTTPTPTAGTTPVPEERETQTAIQKLVTDYADALNQRDAARFAQLFHNDAEYVNVIGRVIRGRPTSKPGTGPSSTVVAGGRACPISVGLP